MMIDDIGAVLVLYNEDYKSCATVVSINDALERSDYYLDIFIYDNSIVSQCPDYEFTYRRLNITYVHNPLNPGVSKAYNSGALFFSNHPIKKRFLLLLDQDTFFSTNIFEEYKRANLKNPKIKLFAPVLKLSSGVFFSPCLYKFGRGFPVKRVHYGVNDFKKLSVVNSGMLVDMNTYFELGMYNDKIALDFSDFYFIDKFKSHHESFFIVNSIAIQAFSNDETDIEKLEFRFRFFCSGARVMSRRKTFGRFLYFMICLIRASRLYQKTGDIRFFYTFRNYYSL